MVPFKPTPNSARAVKEAFIRAKYVQKLFIAKSDASTEELGNVLHCYVDHD